MTKNELLEVLKDVPGDAHIILAEWVFEPGVMMYSFLDPAGGFTHPSYFVLIGQPMSFLVDDQDRAFEEQIQVDNRTRKQRKVY